MVIQWDIRSFFFNGTLILVIFNHIFGTKVSGGMGSLSSGVFRTSHFHSSLRSMAVKWLQNPPVIFPAIHLNL